MSKYGCGIKVHSGKISYEILCSKHTLARKKVSQNSPKSASKGSVVLYAMHGELEPAAGVGAVYLGDSHVMVMCCVLTDLCCLYSLNHLITKHLDPSIRDSTAPSAAQGRPYYICPTTTSLGLISRWSSLHVNPDTASQDKDTLYIKVLQEF